MQEIVADLGQSVVVLSDFVFESTIIPVLLQDRLVDRVVQLKISLSESVDRVAMDGG